MMAQDIRDLLKEDKATENLKMPKGHKERFARLLDEELPKSKKNNLNIFFKIAASVVVLLAVGVAVYQFTKQDIVTPEVVEVDKNTPNSAEQITLGAISPDLKKVEDYYVANINLELADLDFTDENKELLEGYMSRLGELNDEYKVLTEELNEVGPNEQTINALINNLQLRLQLLYRLKEKIKELKKSNNEKFTTQKV
ncbi:hypothetical protein [Galbibacter sp. EGI 63066]|uniref:hypothetical protein n=1 Tax=Galbibacter sp. EGI 63066 TaxID=2993559 RepID=UPI002B061613|nr:hypothetical protein [Galbibacter sp. EGI 63066]